MSADFVAALIAGFEGTLAEVLDRLPEGLLRGEIEELQDLLRRTRERLEAHATVAT